MQKSLVWQRTRRWKSRRRVGSYNKETSIANAKLSPRGIWHSLLSPPYNAEYTLGKLGKPCLPCSRRRSRDTGFLSGALTELQIRKIREIYQEAWILRHCKRGECL